VPAVYVAAQVGPSRVLDTLRAFGFASLGGDAARYGAAIALGDGEVRLTELAGAYSTLARGGERIPISIVRAAVGSGGARVVPERGAPAHVIEPRIAAVLTDILSDDAARSAAFGRDSALAFPFPVAAKTGTSKGYRDNWTVGYTHEVTVAVWVGNFDGTPMTGSTGVTGAGPLFHDVMLAAMRGRAMAPLVQHDGLVELEVCALSGDRPGSSCRHRVEELFLHEHAPERECAIHVRSYVDTSNGLLVHPGCADAEPRIFEAYPPRYAAWAAVAGRPTAPTAWSPRCAPESLPSATRQVARIVEPADGARFLVDAALPEAQEVVFAATPAANDRRVSFVLDGRAIGVVEAPFELPWRLVPGRHRLEAHDAIGAASAPITFEVVE
jgi:penicillin-binding protein 1C